MSNFSSQFVNPIARFYNLNFLCFYYPNLTEEEILKSINGLHASVFFIQLKFIYVFSDFCYFHFPEKFYVDTIRFL